MLSARLVFVHAPHVRIMFVWTTPGGAQDGICFVVLLAGSVVYRCDVVLDCSSGELWNGLALFCMVLDAPGVGVVVVIYPFRVGGGGQGR